MGCSTLVPYTGVMPKSDGLTLEEEVLACVAYREWHQDTYIPWLTANAPVICLASDFADTLFDTSKYQGIYNSLTTYSLGQSASIGQDIYVSNIDGNTTTPPSASWVLLPKSGITLSGDGQQILKIDGSTIKNQATALGKINGIATPPTMIAEMNIEPIARTATGVYAVEFSTPMDNSDYIVLPMTGESNGFATADAETVNGFILRIRKHDGVLTNDVAGFIVVGGKN